MAASLPLAWSCSAMLETGCFGTGIFEPAAKWSFNGAGSVSDKKRAAADMQLVDEKARAKKFKATELAPSKANKAVWSSIFLSSRPEEKETYGCRALSSRGWA